MSKVMKKKILSILMIAWVLWTSTIGLCFAGTVVPAKMSILYKVDGIIYDISETIVLNRQKMGESAVVATPLEITNLSAEGTLQMEQLRMAPEGDWVLLEKTDFDAADADSAKLYLYVPESTGDFVFTYDANNTSAGAYKPTDFTIPAQTTKSITLQGEAGFYDKQFDHEPVAKAVVTISKYYNLDDLKKVTWSGTTDAAIAAVVQALDAGKLTPSDLTWAVGDSRTVTLTNGNTAQLVIWDVNTGAGSAAYSYNLTDTAEDNYTTTGKNANYIIGIQGLNMTGQMFDKSSYTGSWSNSLGRTTVNGVYDTLPTTIRNVFKTFETVTADAPKSSTLERVSDHLALTATKEVIGGTTPTSYSSGNANIGRCSKYEFDALIQFQYFATTSNRYMYVNGSLQQWWQRSPGDSTSYYCYVNGTAKDSATPTRSYAFVPFGCI